MRSPRSTLVAVKRVEDHDVPIDFCKVFRDHMNHFYTLALLLTADNHQAEQCFVASLEDCVRGNTAVRDCAETWARRAIIKNAIGLIPLRQNRTSTTMETCGTAEPISDACTLVGAITKLQPFDRFVYVISVLEKYSDRECSRLLNCALAEIVDARIRVFQQLASHLNQAC